MTGISTPHQNQDDCHCVCDIPAGWSVFSPSSPSSAANAAAAAAASFSAASLASLSASTYSKVKQGNVVTL